MKIKLYTCTTNIDHEITVEDMIGSIEFFTNVEALKEECPCWDQCGISEIEVDLSTVRIITLGKRCY